MLKQKLPQLIILGAIVLSVLAIVQITSMSAAAKPSPFAPSGSTAVVELFPYVGITQTTASPAVNVSAYNWADCYNYITMGVVNTTTVALQHSAFQSNWVTVATYTPDVTTTNDFTTSTVYGQYWRANVTVTNSNPITGDVVCVFR